MPCSICNARSNGRKDQAATAAAREGAGYPQLGAACNMSRQGARRRWPGLVPGAHPGDTLTPPRPAGPNG
ncbi:hypothetical protein GXW82_00940 [Streptacidiphilus sp. 4-A2]|nr:hypothetical protein [Streptacidiphilus sp. 4-A2]